VRDAAQTLIQQGYLDPISEKSRVRARQAERAQLEAAQSMSFDNCASAYFKAHQAAPSRVAQRETQSSMGKDASDLCLASLWLAPCRGNRHRLGCQGFRTRRLLDQEN
jgi:hypothetical protein